MGRIIAAGGRVEQCSYLRMYDTLREFYAASDTWDDSEQTRISRETVRQLVLCLDDIQSRLTTIQHALNHINL